MPRKPLTDDVQDDIVRRYTKLGHSFGLIAMAHSVSPTTVSRVLSSKGVEIRRGGSENWKARFSFARTNRVT